MKVLLFLQVGGHTHSQGQFINYLSVPPFLFPSLVRGDLVRVRCGDNLTWTQNIHLH